MPDDAALRKGKRASDRCDRGLQVGCGWQVGCDWLERRLASIQIPSIRPLPAMDAPEEDCARFAAHPEVVTP
jgi:hypothetical protein